MKRLIDVVVASLALLLLSIPLGMLALLVGVWIGRPVLFRQIRPGRYGRPFEILKFRTMCEAYGPDGKLLPDSVRMTPFGRVLRSTSLDELPELWNVVKGDMSLVGPRPLLSEYLPLYSLEQARRHEIRPGITGWAQINGRNALSWEEKFELDVWYVDNQSLRLDLKILGRTVLALLRPRGINQPGHVTMERFRGTDQ